MEDLDALVRRVDEDRWLASRFAPPEVRARLIALYAAYYEIAHSVEVVREPALGDVRLEWWRAGVAEIAAGKAARAHPVLHALGESGAPLATLPEIIATRGRDLAAAPFTTWAALDAYIDGTAGALLRGAIEACGADIGDAFVQSAGRAWGYAGLLRAAEHWRARGRNVIPAEGSAEEMHARARTAYVAAASQSAPARAFAALGYVAFVPGYLKALARGRRETPLFARHWRLIAASLRGRV